MLNKLAARCRRELNESVVPFWLEHSLDRACGGYFSALDRDGGVYDTRKYMWLQGREVWMFARLYNEWDHRPEYLEAARLGAAFIRKFGRDDQGRLYFSLTRDGRPLAYQRKPYGAVFVMMGLLEYGKATGDPQCLREAEEWFWKIVSWIDDPTVIGQLPCLPGAPRVSVLANEMVLMSMAMELLAVRDDARVRGVLRAAVQRTQLHYDAGRRVLMELVSCDGTSLKDSPEGRLFNPGHSVEVAWFLLHALEHLPDESACRQLALDTLEGSLELGWDPEFGGLFYLLDVEGKPPLQLEHNMKLWWPHTEALYALVLAAVQTGDRRWLAWLEKIEDYTWKHFPDPQHGEWFGYCDRQGNPTHTCKGGNYKGFFHVPRALLFCAQRIEKANGVSPGLHDVAAPNAEYR